MKKNIVLKLITLKIVVFVLIGGLLDSCQPYHDTTAHFNAYYLANQRLEEVEDKIFARPDNDFNHVLDILVPLDTNKTKSEAENLEYIIEMASKPIQFHERSKWTDDCYILLGKARLYQDDYPNAIQTFKYVNTTSDDIAAQHQAQVVLMRLFMELDREMEMLQVREYIRKNNQQFNVRNNRDFHLVFAQYYKEKDEYDLASQHLALAVPAVENRQEKARLYYTLGQLYLLSKDRKKALLSFQNAKKFSKYFEMEFHSLLKIKSLSGQDEYKTPEKVEHYFEKLAKEPKNWDFRDKIYYEYAMFELRHQDTLGALDHLNESIQLGGANVMQKAYSYLKTGKIYFTQVDYPKAALYYDSSIQIMPKEVKGYEDIAARAEVLKEFSDSYTRVKKEERLVTLASLEADSLKSFLQVEMEHEKEKAILIAEYQKSNEKRRRKPAALEGSKVAEGQQSSFYFYNDAAAVKGGSEFLRKWGSRKLEDYWRVSSIQVYDEAQQEPEENVDNQPPPMFGRGGQPVVKDKKKNKKDPEGYDPELFANIASIEDRMKEIPATEEALQVVHDSLESALFDLGRSYFFGMELIPDATETFLRQKNQYQQGVHVPEALYILYTYCLDNTCDEEMYKKMIIEGYPESFYAKILINPNYVKEENQKMKDIETHYQDCYNLFRKEQFQLADSLVTLSYEKYPENHLKERFELLAVMIVGHTQKDKSIYKKELQTFIETHEESDILPYAEQLLNAFDGIYYVEKKE